MFALLGRLLAVTALVVVLPSLDARSPAWAAEALTRGGTLRVALDMDPAVLDPILSDAQNRDRNIFNLFYENLIRLDGHKIVPVLAESWTFGPDGKSITFRLRAGVQFHDGTPFDAAAVKTNLDRAASPQTNPRTAGDLADIAGVEVIDPLTVRISLKQPSGVVVANLAGAVAMMVSPRALASPEDLKRKPVGTGPFRFASWQNDIITTERFDGYWGHDPEGGKLPYLDGVVLRFIRASAVKIVEARSGNIDLADGIQTKDFAQIEREPSLQLSENPQGVHQYIAFNVTRPPIGICAWPFCMALTEPPSPRS